MVAVNEVCAACGGCELCPHLRVAGPLGAHGLIPTTDQFGSALADIVRCARCGHMQCSPMPAGAVLSQAYAQAESEDYVGEEIGQRATARRALERVERHLAVPGPGRLLDLGCWVGFLMAEARAMGWEALGVEPSAFAAGYARERLGLEVLEAGLPEARLPAHSFTAVTLGDVLEHLVDPGSALRRVSELLVDDGLLWMAIPDAGSTVARALGRRWWSVIPTHVQYFTRASVRELLHATGFEVLEITTSPKAFTVGYYLRRLGGYSPALGSAAVAGARALRVDQRLWAPDFRDRMAVIARPHRRS